MCHHAQTAGIAAIRAPQGAGEGGVGSANTDRERQSAVSFLGPDANV